MFESQQTERKCATKINAKELGQILFQKANNGYALEKHPIKVVVHLDVTLATGVCLQVTFSLGIHFSISTNGCFITPPPPPR